MTEVHCTTCFIDADSIQQDEPSEFEEESNIASLSSSVLDYEYENGRRYHSNRAVSFTCPNSAFEKVTKSCLGQLLVQLNPG